MRFEQPARYYFIINRKTAVDQGGPNNRVEVRRVLHQCNTEGLHGRTGVHQCLPRAKAGMRSHLIDNSSTYYCYILIFR